MSKSFHFAWMRWKQFSLWAVLAAGLAALVLTYGPRIEERIWPIITDVQVVDKEKAPDGGPTFPHDL